LPIQPGEAIVFRRKGRRMKKTALRIAGALTVTLLLAGCGERSDQPGVQEAYEDATATIREAAEESGEVLSGVWDDVADFSAERKDELISAMKNGYAKLSDQAGPLADKAGDAGSAAAERFRRTGDTFQEQLKKAGDASADAWDATKDGLAKGWAEVTEAFEQLRQKAGAD
jgi:hypothetical protein